MYTKTKLKGGLLLLAAGLLAGCANGPSESSGFGSSTGNAPKEIDYTSVYSALSTMKGAHNFTADTTVTANGGVSTTYSNVYTEDFTWCDYEGAEEGFAYKDGSVFRLNLDEQGNMVASDAYLDASGEKLTSIWGGDLFTTPLLSPESVKDKDARSIEITSKDARFQMLEFNVLDTTLISSVTSVHAEIRTLASGFDRLVLSIEANFDGTDYVYETMLSTFGNSTSGEVTDYLATSGASVYDSSLVAAAKAFKTERFYKHTYESLTYTPEAERKEIGVEVYTPDYWYGGYTDSAYYIFSTGYVSLPQKYYVGDGAEEPIALDGAYKFMLSQDMKTLTNVMLYAPAFTTNISNMADIMDYPSKMIMWDHMFQYFAPYESESYDFKGSGFMTENSQILLDFFYNSQVLNSLQASITVTSLSVESLIIYVDDTSGNVSDINFILNMMVNGSRVAAQFSYDGFGSAALPCVDQWIDENIIDQ